jgi:hypothetical protein
MDYLYGGAVRRRRPHCKRSAKRCGRSCILKSDVCHIRRHRTPAGRVVYVVAAPRRRRVVRRRLY